MKLMENLFKNIERVYTGKIVKDYGYINEGRCRYKIMITQKGRKHRVVIKQKIKIGLGMEVNYFDFDQELWEKIMDIGKDAIYFFDLKTNEPSY